MYRAMLALANYIASLWVFIGKDRGMTVEFDLEQTLNLVA